MKFKIEYGTWDQGFKVWDETRKVLHLKVAIDYYKPGNIIYDPAGNVMAALYPHPATKAFQHPNEDSFILALTEGDHRYVMSCKDHHNYHWCISDGEDTYYTYRYADGMTCVFQHDIVVAKIGLEKRKWYEYKYIDFEMLDNYNRVLFLSALLFFFPPPAPNLRQRFSIDIRKLMPMVVIV